MAEVTVGVDIGTTSVKAIAVDGDGTVVDRARIPHEARVPAPDRLEHDADAAWREGVVKSYGQVAAAHQVAGVQVTAMVPSLCAVDAGGHALTPGLLYGDARSGRSGAGDPTNSGEMIGFAEWCAEAAPDAAGFWPAQAMANHALGGDAVIDTVLAMMAMPLFDGSGWSEEACRAIGIRPDQLPPVLQSGQKVGEVGDAALGAGTIDAYTEQLCSGVGDDGDVLVICGTTLITWLVAPEWIEAPGLWTVPSLAAGKSMIGGPSNAGGLFLEWAKRLTGVATGTDDATDPGCVPVWTPYIRGERTPLHDPNLRASLHGLDLTHGPAELLRAAYEAAGFVVRHHIELAGEPARRIIATGGGVRDPRWMQALADVTGLPVDLVAVPEGAAYGAAFLARVVAGLETDPAHAERWARVAKTVEPRAAWSDAVEERYERFRSHSPIAT